MNIREDKLLIGAFLTIALLLVGILLQNLYSNTDQSLVLWNTKKSDFEQRFPRSMLQTSADWHFEALRETSTGLPEIIFTFPYNEKIDAYSRRARQLVQSEYEVLDSLRQDDIAVFGIGYDKLPLGKVVLQKDPIPKRVTVGIIIDDFGYYNNGVVEGFLNLPPQLTLAIIPGHQYSREIAQAASSNGFEVIIHMPMEPENYSGGEEEYILKSSMTAKQITGRIQKAITLLPMASGMNNHQGSLASQDPVLMETVLRTLDQNGMYFVDSKTVPESVGDSLAQKLGIPHGVRRVFLDNKQDTTYIKGQLKALVDHAIRGGKVIGIGHDKRKTLEVLREYIPYYESRGIRFSRVSDVLTYPKPVM